MANQSGSARFQAHFEPALQEYERKTGIKLAEHPLALQLQSCNSVVDITALLQGQAQAFSNLQGSDKIMESIKATVSILTPLAATTSPADDVGLVWHNALMA
jgi:hypothetical protein